MSKAYSRNWLTRPARPNSRIKPRPTTNGGVMMGSKAITRKGVWMRALALRSAIKAIIVPKMVVPVAVSSARKSVFHATPQRTPPTRQFRPQTRSLPMRLNRAVMDQRPSSVRNAPYRALVTGNAMNKSSITEQPSTADAMNRSPLK